MPGQSGLVRRERAESCWTSDWRCVRRVWLPTRHSMAVNTRSNFSGEDDALAADIAKVDARQWSDCAAGPRIGRPSGSRSCPAANRVSRAPESRFFLTASAVPQKSLRGSWRYCGWPPVSAR
jgi:hypothetical protein